MTPAAAVEVEKTVSSHEAKIQNHESAIAELRSEMRDGFKSIDKKLWGLIIGGLAALVAYYLNHHP